MKIFSKNISQAQISNSIQCNDFAMQSTCHKRTQQKSDMLPAYITKTTLYINTKIFLQARNLHNY